MFDNLDSACTAPMSLGFKHNCSMATKTSGLKTGRLTRACVHSGKHRTGKKPTDPIENGSLNNDNSSFTKLDCPCYFYGYVVKKRSGEFLIKRSDSVHNHQLGRFPEAVVLDTTYNTNKQKSKLLNFVVSSTLASREGRQKGNQLATIPLAATWLDRETRESYMWALKALHNITWPEGSSNELPKVFVANNDISIRHAIKEVFPESLNVLCYVHIKHNFMKKFIENMLSLKDKKKLEDRREKLSFIINELALSCKTEEQLNECMERYRSLMEEEGLLKAGGTDDLMEYMNGMLIQRKHWISLDVDQHLHMGCRTTNRVEGTHAAIQHFNRNSKGFIGSVTEAIDRWYQIRENYRNHQQEKESLTVRKEVVLSPVYHLLQPLVRRVTAFALVKIKNQLIKGLALEEAGKLDDDDCSCYTKNCLRLPCKHTLVKAIETYGCIPLTEVHERWHILYQNGQVRGIGGIPDVPQDNEDEEERVEALHANSQKVSEVTGRSKKFELMDSLKKQYLYKLHTLFNNIEEIFTESVSHQEMQTILDNLQTVEEKAKEDSLDLVKNIGMSMIFKGRPKKDKRQKIGVERAMEAFLEKRKNLLKTPSSNKERKSNADHQTSAKKLKVDVVLEDEYEEQSQEVTDEELEADDSYYDRLLSQVDPNIPKDNYSVVIDVVGDGFCGWRVLAVQIFDNEDEFWTIKKKTRDTLLNSEKFYKDIFKDYFDFEDVKKRVCYGIEEEVGSEIIKYELFSSDEDNGDAVFYCGQEHYFSSVGCAQLAADTFFVPVGLYSEKSIQIQEEQAIFLLCSTTQMPRSRRSSLNRYCCKE